VKNKRQEGEEREKKRREGKKEKGKNRKKIKLGNFWNNKR
jgi:hypothetical protein